MSLKKRSLRAGFEPARENPIGFRVQRLNHSAITAPAYFLTLSIYLHSYIMFHRKLHKNITTLFAQYLGSRNSSVGRASDWRSEGPWFNPGFRHRNNRRLAHFLFYFLNICICFYFYYSTKNICCAFFAFYWTAPRTSEYRRNSLSPHVLTKQNVTSCHLVMLYLGCQEKQHKINIKWQLRKTRKSSHTGNRTRAAWVKARNPNH